MIPVWVMQVLAIVVAVDPPPASNVVVVVHVVAAEEIDPSSLDEVDNTPDDASADVEEVVHHRVTCEVDNVAYRTLVDHLRVEDRDDDILDDGVVVVDREDDASFDVVVALDDRNAMVDYDHMSFGVVAWDDDDVVVVVEDESDDDEVVVDLPVDDADDVAVASVDVLPDSLAEKLDRDNLPVVVVVPLSPMKKEGVLLLLLVVVVAAAALSQQLHLSQYRNDEEKSSSSSLSQPSLP